MKNLYPHAMALAAAATLALSCTNRMKITPGSYPQTRRDTTVMDDYFGVRVADPYRWLEDDRSAETAAWVEAQNTLTRSYLDRIPFRAALRDRLAALYDYPSAGVPARHGDYYYSFRNDGRQNQSVLCRARTLTGPVEVFLDPNALSSEGTVAVSAVAFSPDNRRMAYSEAAAGSDWVKIRVMDTETGALADDCIEWVKFSGAAWAADSEGFYYSGYDKPSGSVLSEQNRCQTVYYHKLGTPQRDDRIVHRDERHPMRYFSGEESRDGRWVIVTASEGTSGSEILCRPAAGGAMRTVLPGFAHDYEVVDCRGDRLYVRTNDGAPNGRLASLDLRRPETGLVDVIPEREGVLLEGVTTCGGYLWARYLEDACHRVVRYDYAGRELGEVALPALGTVTGFSGEEEAAECFYGLNTFTSPQRVYRYDPATGRSEPVGEPRLPFDPDDYVTEQVFFPSTGGARVPMFISHRRDFTPDGQAPCYLYGYGGFQINLTPSFKPEYILLMEQGGVVVTANLRGGAEYGEAWHRDGMLDRKQHVFDDFIGAAEWLIAHDYTSRRKLAVAGGSNGGLLVGACEVQRPDLFAVCLPAVGVMDMLRYQHFTIGRGWAVEYGLSENEAQFPYLYKYSPLHNIRDGVSYPATLVTTGDHDDRVVPAHSYKFSATMQRAQAGDAPVLLRIERDAGHGAGKSLSKRIDESADCFAFLFWNTDTPYKRIK